MKSLLVAIAAFLSALYLVYPSLGIFELIPDALPFVGSIDEAAAMTILLACARYFGFDFSKFFGSKSKDKEDIVDIK